MPEFSMTCDTFYRITRALPPKDDKIHDSWRTIRIDGGCIVAGDRSFIAIEHFDHCDGIAHIVPDQGLIDQCKTEAMYGGRVVFVVNDLLRFATAKTTFGYVTTGNILYQDSIDPDWPRWREIIKRIDPETAKARGAMYWNIEGMKRLIESSPSGGVVFEEKIDCERTPLLVRDVIDYNWMGIFHPMAGSQTYHGATLPSWIK